MKNLRLFILMTAFAVLASCNFDGTQKTSTTPVPKKEKLTMDVSALSDKNDLVCGMELTNETFEDTTSYNGKLYGFCNEGCKKEFLKEPAKFISQK